MCEGTRGRERTYVCLCARERERTTFLDPENPADSVKKYANGRRIKRHRLQPRNTSFHSPTRTYSVHKHLEDILLILAQEKPSPSTMHSLHCI